MEHDAHAPPPAAQELGDASASASVVDDWARDEDTEPMAVDPHHAAAAAATATEDGEGVADAAPPAAPAEDVTEIQSSLQSLELKTNAAAHEDAQEVVEEEKETKRHLNVVFIGHVDAGKSTAGGQILFLSGQVDDRTIQKY
ncbi:Os04g0270100, partial [Oryza sativa Japonica Group]